MKITFDEFKRRVLSDYVRAKAGDDIAQIILDKFADSLTDVCIEVSNGPLFDAIYTAAMQRMPKIFVWRNIPSSKHTNSDILKLLSGFSSIFKKQTLNIQTVKGNDYAALCITIEKQIAFTRTNHAPSVIVIEQSADSLAAFKQWILDKEISTELELDNL